MRLLPVVFLFATPARADEVDVELVAKAFAGKSKPAVVLKVNRALERAEIELAGPGGRVLKDARGAVKKGTTMRFELDAPLGVSHWDGTLRVTFSGGSGGAMPLSFDVEVADRFAVQTSYDKLDLGKGTVQIQLNRKAGRCDYDVAYDGKAPRTGTQPFAGESAGTWLTVSWPTYSPEDVVLRIRLTCWDAEGAYHTDAFEMYPWWLEIPHEDVNFESAKWEIGAAEEPKLARACEEIDKALRRYGKVVDVKLYVSGHTDTVGDAPYNRDLSEKRARAIASVFRKRCVETPIFYSGRGEDEPAVATPDQTDEPRNRRARYILGVEAPDRGGWRKL